MKNIILIHKSYKISGKYRENNKPLKQSIFFPSKLYENVNLFYIMLKHYRKQKYKHGWYKRKCQPFTFYKSRNKHVLVQNNKTIYTKVYEANKIFWLLFQGIIANNFQTFHFVQNDEQLQLMRKFFDLTKDRPWNIKKMYIPNGKIVI